MQHVLNIYLLPHIVKLKRSVFSLGFDFLRFVCRASLLLAAGLPAVARTHVQISIDNSVRFVSRILQSEQRLRVLQLNTALHVLLEVNIFTRLPEHQRALRLVLVLFLMPARIIRRVSVPHQVFLVNVFYWLKVAFGRLKFETVALLERNLEMFFRFAFRRERFTLGQLLVLEKRSWHELRVLRVWYCCRILLRHCGT